MLSGNRYFKASAAKLLIILVIFVSNWPLSSNAYAAESKGSGSDFQQAFDFMKGLGCVQGYTDGQAHLDDTLTRAQAVTVLVNCTGQSSTAKILTGAPAFPDTGNHPWASGAIAVAKNMGWVNGYPDGKFHPDEKVTYGELVQMLDNALGLQTNAALGWPERAVKAAVDAGFLSSDANLLAYADGFAPRGAAFFYANSAFMNVPLASGKTVYQTYLKTSAPTLTASASAAETEQSSVEITGSTKGATAVNCAGVSASLNADGSFTCTVSLKDGDNLITITASDIVNNTATVTVSVQKIKPQPVVTPPPVVHHNYTAQVMPSGNVSIFTGQEQTVTFAVYDNDISVRGLNVTFSVYGSLEQSGLSTPTWNADGTVSVTYTGTTTGIGHIVLSVRGSSVPGGQSGTITVLAEPKYILADPEPIPDDQDTPVMVGFVGETKTIKFKVIDAREHPVAGVTLDLQMQGTLPANLFTNSFVITGSDGVATVQITAYTAGQGTVQATVRGLSVSGTTGLIQYKSLDGTF